MKHSTKSKLLSVIMAGMMATSIGAVSASAASLPQIQLQAPQSITVLQDTANKAKSDLQALKDSAPKLSTQFDKTPILGQGSLFGSSAVKDAGYGKAKVKLQSKSTRMLPDGWRMDTARYSNGAEDHLYSRKTKNGNTQIYGDHWEKGKRWQGKVREFGSPSHPVTIKKGSSFKDAAKAIAKNTKKINPPVAHSGSGRAYKK